MTGDHAGGSGLNFEAEKNPSWTGYEGQDIPSKLIVPLLSVSISFIRSSSSVSDGLRLNERITAPSSEAVISPSYPEYQHGMFHE